MNRGGKSLAYAQSIASNRTSLSTERFDLYVEREATLDERLEQVSSRYVRRIVLVLNEGFGEKEREVHMSRGMAAALAGALEKALRATDDEEWR